MSCDLICINLKFIHLLDSLPPPWNPSLLKSALLLFLSSMEGILIIKSKLKLVWGRVLLVGSVTRWRWIKRIILVVVLQSFLLVINSQLSVKSALGNLTMLSRPPNSLTPQTVRNELKEAGFRSATMKKVPMLKWSHCQHCLKFAQYHKNWTLKDWKRVLWTDETKVNKIGSDGKVYLWKRWWEPVLD